MSEVAFVEMEPTEAFVDRLVLEQSSAAVDVIRDRLVTIPRVAAKLVRAAHARGYLSA